MKFERSNQSKSSSQNSTCMNHDIIFRLIEVQACTDALAYKMLLTAHSWQFWRVISLLLHTYVLIQCIQPKEGNYYMWVHTSKISTTPVPIWSVTVCLLDMHLQSHWNGTAPLLFLLIMAKMHTISPLLKCTLYSWTLLKFKKAQEVWVKPWKWNNPGQNSVFFWVKSSKTITFFLSFF